MSNKACSMYPCLVDEANSTICQKTEALEVVRPTKTGKSRSAATSRSKTVWAISERRGEEETLR
jgi:Zn-finger protein